MWSGNIYDTDDQFIQNELVNPASFNKIFVEPVAESLRQEVLKRVSGHLNFTTFRKSLENITGSGSNFWLSYASAIVNKLRSINLFLRPYSEFCRTCIITEGEIDALVRLDLDQFFNINIPVEKKTFFTDLNYLIPSKVKEAGYEIIRSEEVMGINMAVIGKIARVIHSRYIHEIQNHDISNRNENRVAIEEFDKLPVELQHSNIDNASHIPTKLLAVGFRIRPVSKGHEPFALHLDEEEIETMARVEHLRWSWEKRLNGWVYGEKKDDSKKTHPALIPYDELEEKEKEKDRGLVRLIPGLLKDIGYEAYPILPRDISRLSYAIKPRSNIFKLLCETNKLSEEIRDLAESSPAINAKISAISEKIKVTIGEVQGSYNYARHIQQTFLPDDLYIRECFSDSFVLFKPKDIVSGDFYFFSRHSDLIVFALADCTGHGIPGALISTIGYGTLDQAVNVMKMTDTAEILRYLYAGIHRFLRKDLEETGVSDDMDIILCSLNTKTRKLSFSGKGNILLYVTEEKITGIRCSYTPKKGGEDDDPEFTEATLQLKQGDLLYLSSDGIADQAGGSNHKRYSRKRLSDFLMQVHDLPMPEQADRLYEEIERWREINEEDQTDDLTVIGIRF